MERKQHNCLHRKFQGIQTHTLEQIIEFSKTAGYEDTMEKSIACWLYTSNEQLETKLKKIPSTEVQFLPRYRSYKIRTGSDMLKTTKCSWKHWNKA